MLVGPHGRDRAGHPTANPEPTAITWTNITSFMTEPARGPTFTPFAAYYPPMKAVIMFSQNYSGELSSFPPYSNGQWTGPDSLWSFQNDSWTNITSLVHGSWPAWSSNAALTYDPATQSLILVNNVADYRNTSNGTYIWSFRNYTWTAVPTSGPDPFGLESAVGLLQVLGITYDPQYGGLVALRPSQSLGNTGYPIGNSTTWLLINGTWENLTGQIGGSPPPPGAYFLNQLSYDPASSCLLGLFNIKMNFNGTTPAARTWKLCDGNWTMVGNDSSSSDPMGYNIPSQPLSYDPQLEGELYWGGPDDSWVYINGSWTDLHWNGTVPPWTMNPRTPEIFPAPLTVVYDPAESYLLLLGGSYYGASPWSAHLAWGLGQLPPFLNLTANPNPIEANAPLTLTAGLAGGAPPVSFLFSGLPPGCRAADSALLQCRPTRVGNYTIHLLATDGLGRTATGSTLLRVGPSASLVLIASPTATDVEAPIQLHLSVTGGIPPFSYGFSDLPPGCASNNTPSLTCTPTFPGTYTILGAAEDAQGSISTAQTNLTVNPAPTIPSVVLSRKSLDVGQSITLSATSAGGTGPGSWSFLGLPPSCPSVNASKLSCAPAAPGVDTVTVRYTDTLGETAERTVTWSVWPRLTVALTDSTDGNRVLVGKSNEVTAVVSGGLPPVRVVFVGLSGAVVNGTHLTWTPEAPAQYTIVCSVMDGNGESASVQMNLTASAPASDSVLPSVAWAGVGVGAGSAAIAVAVIVWRRRVRSKRDPPGNFGDVRVGP